MAPQTPSHKRQKREDYRKTHNDNHPPELPKKRFYRQRAHANPFSDHQLAYPASPAQMDWSAHYPAYVITAPDATETVSEEGGDAAAAAAAAAAGGIRWLRKSVTVADIGCGFGGLLVALSPLLPDELILGLEIRTQVTTYVTDRIHALRALHAPSPSSSSSSSSLPPSQKPPPYNNISALRTNTMKFLPNFFPRASLRLLFLCFPDPHFKARKHKMRIVSPTLTAEYAYVLRPGGLVYTITDVRDLGEWMRGCFEGAEELFEEVKVDEKGGVAGLEREVLRAVRGETEEGKKVERNKGEKFVGVWRRRADPAWPEE